MRTLPSPTAPEVVTVCCPGSQLHQLNQLCKEAGIRLSIINPDHGGHYSGLEQGAARLAALTAQGLSAEVTQIAVSRTRPAGRLHLLMANNPIFLITGERK